MSLLALNSVTVSWLILFIASLCVGILLARRFGRTVQIRSLVILTLVNIGLAMAMMVLMSLPTNTEAAVYANAEVGSVLILVLIGLFPPTLMFWIVRLRRTR